MGHKKYAGQWAATQAVSPCNNDITSLQNMLTYYNINLIAILFLIINLLFDKDTFRKCLDKIPIQLFLKIDLPILHQTLTIIYLLKMLYLYI